MIEADKASSTSCLSSFALFNPDLKIIGNTAFEFEQAEIASSTLFCNTLALILSNNLLLLISNFIKCVFKFFS